MIVCSIDPNTGKSTNTPRRPAALTSLMTSSKKQSSPCGRCAALTVIPVVHLSERPFKTNYGMRKRPYFDIIGWKTPGGDDAKAVPAKPPTPQLPSPAVAQTPPTTPTAPAAATSTPTSDLVEPYQAKPKPPVKLASETLNAMGDVKPVTIGEILDDEVSW